MLQLAPNKFLITDASELPPSFIGAKHIFCDVETTSRNPALDSLNPWHHCYIAGIAITVDDCQYALYIDYMRMDAENQYKVQVWLQSVIWYCELWINHNIKYDAHVFINQLQLQLSPWMELKCTLTRAKLIDSDRQGGRGGYGLDALCLAWLGRDIRAYEQAIKVYLGRTNKDYGQIPADILGIYACEDVLSNRELDAYIDNRLPERCQNVALTEMKLTKELVVMEQKGLRFDPTELKKAQFITLNRMLQLDKELSVLVGRSFRPHVSNDCCEILCGQYGLPVVAYTKEEDELEEDEEQNASFDKYALAIYKSLPYAPQEVISRIIEFRELSQRNSLFLEPIQELMVDGRIHCTYNQIVRTGRMSCKNPNGQQFDDFIRGLILPDPGYSIISTDASQIEFRLITHYIQNAYAIAEYTNNPNTDFYLLVAGRVGITRKPAKTISLATGYGEGKKKMIVQLSANDDIVASVWAEVNNNPRLTTEQMRKNAFDESVIRRATDTYNAFHKMFPELKQTAKQAEQAVKDPERRLGTVKDNYHYYGYVTNAYGRDRHLPYYGYYRTDYKTKDPYDRAWLAFPTVNQATAADIMKERFVSLRRETIRELPIDSLGLIHDEILLQAPTEIAEDTRALRDIVAVLESPSVPISVPIRWSIGTSRNNWLEAKTSVKDGGVSTTLNYNKSDATNLNFLR